MIYWIWDKIKFLLPYGLIIKLYKNKKSLPITFETKSGNIYRCILVDFNYGIIYSSNKYDKQRLKSLLDAQKTLADEADKIMLEINQLSFEGRERLMDMKENSNEETKGSKESKI